MKKLHLDGLKVDSFTTTPAVHFIRTTGSPACPMSYGGTCWITCAGCDTLDAC